MIEIWKPVPSMDIVYASSLGRIKKGGRPSKLYVTKSGYIICSLHWRQWRVNRLVCAAFHGPCPSIVHQAAHKDGNRGNNAADNLYWATPQENADDVARHGTATRGSKQHKARLTESEVVKIRARRKNGEQVRSIHHDYAHVCYATISHICNNRIWKHV